MFDSFIQTFACKHRTFLPKNVDFVIYNCHNVMKAAPFAISYLKVS